MEQFMDLELTKWVADIAKTELKKFKRYFHPSLQDLAQAEILSMFDTILNVANDTYNIGYREGAKK